MFFFIPTRVNRVKTYIAYWKPFNTQVLSGFLLVNLKFNSSSHAYLYLSIRFKRKQVKIDCCLEKLPIMELSSLNGMDGSFIWIEYAIWCGFTKNGLISLKGRRSTAGVNSVITYKAINCYKKTAFYSTNLMLAMVSGSYKIKKLGTG